MTIRPPHISCRLFQHGAASILVSSPGAVSVLTVFAWHTALWGQPSDDEGGGRARDKEGTTTTSLPLIGVIKALTQRQGSGQATAVRMSGKGGDSWMVLNSACSRPIMLRSDWSSPANLVPLNCCRDFVFYADRIYAGKGSKRRGFRQSREAAVAARFVRASEERNYLVYFPADFFMYRTSQGTFHHRSVRRQ